MLVPFAPIFHLSLLTETLEMAISVNFLIRDPLTPGAFSVGSSLIMDSNSLAITFTGRFIQPYEIGSIRCLGAVNYLLMRPAAKTAKMPLYIVVCYPDANGHTICSI